VARQSAHLLLPLQVGVQPSLSVTYKHSRVKQYFKENRALRTEMTINNPHDFDVAKDLSNWTCLRQLASAINHRLLQIERVSQNCLLSAVSFQRVSEPTVASTGERAPGLRVGQPRAMALFSALSHFGPALNGFRHADGPSVMMTGSVNRVVSWHPARHMNLLFRWAST
jgi:hypothetical protein